MKLTELIENCNLDLDQLKKSRIFNAIKSNYHLDEIMNVGTIFLKGISNKHNVSGDIVYKMTNMIQLHNNGVELTDSQLYGFIMNIIESWDQIDLITRIELDL